MAESIAMATAALADGADVIVATPHQRDVMLRSSPEQVRALAAQLEEAVAQQSPGAAEGRLRIATGMECHIEPDLPDWVKEGKALTLDGTLFILTEPPITGWPPYVDTVLDRLIGAGLTPVLAHPERNVVLQKDSHMVRRLAAGGVLMQVTAGSFIGEHGKGAKRAAESWVRDGLVHCIASDMHGATGLRTPGLKSAFDHVARMLSSDAALLLFDVNPRALLAGRGLAQWPDSTVAGRPPTQAR
jgi:protein-tyrosine phosphatase